MANIIPKYLRAHYVNTAVTSTQALVWFMKVLYEYWGFCINTPSVDQVTPAGFPVGGVAMPAGFESGSLLATGSSGFTNVGESYFHDSAANFTSQNLIGKHLVTWKPGSTSNDDGIYPIRQVYGSGTILVDTNTGATPYSGSLVPLFETRTNINYRIVDIHATATTVSMLSGSGLVMELSGAADVNVGQLLPHVRVKFANTSDLVEVSWSNSGSWDGTSFGSDQRIVPARDWIQTSTANNGHITLIGATDFLLTHFRGGWNTLGSDGFHIEIPTRLLDQELDPNPVVVSVWGLSALEVDDSSTSYGKNSFYMHNPVNDSVATWQPLIFAPQGNFFVNFPDTKLNALIPGRYTNVGYNPLNNKFYTTDVVLSFIESAQFYVASRVKMRRWRLTSDLIPNFGKLGTGGTWIKVNDGILWPWDNANLPYSLFASGQ